MEDLVGIPFVKLLSSFDVGLENPGSRTFAAVAVLFGPGTSDPGYIFEPAWNISRILVVTTLVMMLSFGAFAVVY